MDALLQRHRRGLIVTPSETLLKRAIRPAIARRKAAAEGKPLEPASRPGLARTSPCRRTAAR
jgi:hypothetical protein